ncbi:T9SS type A sorting domain-containing protein [Hoylesella saccharolytica]|uniref:T9SS type A sorting domain-containing protein n=1 Tax=Hoylesella saccharolytica TaxID=633701 RepID=UPI001F305C8B|nr:T9SS type A sorting domain-containing protein [Hoylesella saccharolytica]
MNEIMISNADMADVPELQDVHFSQGASRDYRLDTKSDYICRWKSPKGRYLSGESVTLDEDGQYILELTNNDGCSTTRTLNVSTMAGDGFARHSVSPNPTTDGNVNIRVEMSESLPLEFRLYSPDGALLQKETRLADTYHATRCYLPMSGVYVLEMSSGNSKKSIKLIRK